MIHYFMKLLSLKERTLKCNKNATWIIIFLVILIYPINKEAQPLPEPQQSCFLTINISGQGQVSIKNDKGMLKYSEGKNTIGIWCDKVIHLILTPASDYFQIGKVTIGDSVYALSGKNQADIKVKLRTSINTMSASVQYVLRKPTNEELKVINDYVLFFKNYGYDSTGNKRMFIPLKFKMTNPALSRSADSLLNDSFFKLFGRKVIALICRLCAASILIGNEDPQQAAIDAIPWIARSIEFDSSASDIMELKSILTHFKNVRNGKVESIPYILHLTYCYRLALPYADIAEVRKWAKYYEGIARGPVVKNECNTSARDDLEYLNTQRVKGATIGIIMRDIKQKVSEAYPDKRISNICVPSPFKECGSKITYNFNGRDNFWFEWYSSTAKDSIAPLNDNARALMNGNWDIEKHL